MSTTDEAWDYCRLTIRPHDAEQIPEEEELPLLLALVDDLEQLSEKGWHLASIRHSNHEDRPAFDVVLKRPRVATIAMHGTEDGRQTSLSRFRRAA